MRISALTSRRVAFVLGAFVALACVAAGWVWMDRRPPPDTTRLAAGAAERWVNESARRAAAQAHKPWFAQGAGWQILPTALHGLDILNVPLPAAQGRGGAIAALQDGLLVATPRGDLYRVASDGTFTGQAQPVPMGLEDLAQSAFAADRRFLQDLVRTLDLLVVPGAQGPRLLVAHHAYAAGCLELRVSVAPWGEDEGVLGPFETLYAAQPCLTPIAEEANRNRNWFGDHSGGRLLLLDPETVLLTVGDHGMNGTDAPEAMAEGDLGRVIQIDLATGAADAFAQGLRNSQGLAQDDQGRLWLTDHGPQGGDELNQLTKGAHFGWPYVTFGTNYGDKPWTNNPVQGRHDGYTAPVFAWTPAIGVSNLIAAPVAQFPLWEGDLLVASLRQRTLFRMRPLEGRIVYAEPLELGARLRDIAVLDTGVIALLTDDNGLLLLRNAALGHAASWTQAATARAGATSIDTKDKGAQAVYAAACGSCHALDTEAGGIGPHLVGLLGRAVGSVDGHPYSQALREAGGVWTRDRLETYLRNPDSVPGALMPQLWLRDAEIALILEALESQ